MVNGLLPTVRGASQCLNHAQQGAVRHDLSNFTQICGLFALNLRTPWNHTFKPYV
jgi:hypothetical protein